MFHARLMIILVIDDGYELHDNKAENRNDNHGNMTLIEWCT